MEKLSPVPSSRKEEVLKGLLTIRSAWGTQSLVSVALSVVGGELAEKGSSSSEQY